MIVVIVGNSWNFLLHYIYVRRGLEIWVCCEVWREETVRREGSVPSPSSLISFYHGTTLSPVCGSLTRHSPSRVFRPVSSVVILTSPG